MIILNFFLKVIVVLTPHDKFWVVPVLHWLSDITFSDFSKYQLKHNSFILQQYICYTTLLYMFRAARCLSSGGPIVSPQPLVSSPSVSSRTVCRESGLQSALHLHTVRLAGCCSILQTGQITFSSTPDQQLENHSTKYHRQQPLYNTLELLMMGIVVPETC